MPPIPPIPPEPPPLYSFIGNYNKNSQDSNYYQTNISAEASNCKITVRETYLLESDFISRNPLIGNYNNNSQDSNSYQTNFSAEASNCKKTVHETYLLESDFISRNPLIGNNFVAIKNSVVKCFPLVEVNPPIADLADKLLLLDINSL